MASDMSTVRRVPQERGERRVAQLLDTAAGVIAAVGFEPATMTEIAERAGVSIGTVYQYFPNKTALVDALRVRFSHEWIEHTADLEAATATMSVARIAAYLVGVMASFLETHPAYFQVMDASVKPKRNPDARRRLRERFATVFRSRNAALTEQQAYRMANICVEILKSMSAMYAAASSTERTAIVAEYEAIFGGYLAVRLDPR